MLCKRLSVILMVLAFAACLIPATVLGGNPWDPDKPKGKNSSSSQSSPGSQDDATVEEGIVADDSGLATTNSSQTDYVGQSRVELNPNWLDMLKSYLERMLNW